MKVLLCNGFLFFLVYFIFSFLFVHSKYPSFPWSWTAPIEAGESSWICCHSILITINNGAWPFCFMPYCSTQNTPRGDSNSCSGYCQCLISGEDNQAVASLEYREPFSCELCQHCILMPASFILLHLIQPSLNAHLRSYIVPFDTWLQ